MSHLSTAYAQVVKNPAIFFICLALTGWPVEGLPASSIQLEIGGESYSIEIASTSSERRRGLMYRQSLARNAGMLLVYRRSGDHRIWMKNVPIPLRVYWIDKDLRVVAMRLLQPCAENPCPIYSAGQDSSYVLELGDYDHDLSPGDRLEGLRDL